MGHKVRVVVEAEFETLDGKPLATATSAIIRLGGEIRHAIVYGSTGSAMSTGINPDSVTVQFLEKEIDDEPVK